MTATPALTETSAVDLDMGGVSPSVRQAEKRKELEASEKGREGTVEAAEKGKEGVEKGKEAVESAKEKTDATRPPKKKKAKPNAALTRLGAKTTDELEEIQKNLRAQTYQSDAARKRNNLMSRLEERGAAQDKSDNSMLNMIAMNMQLEIQRRAEEREEAREMARIAREEARQEKELQREEAREEARREKEQREEARRDSERMHRETMQLMQQQTQMMMAFAMRGGSQSLPLTFGKSPPRPSSPPSFQALLYDRSDGSHMGYQRRM